MKILTKNARALRKDMTAAERKLWWLVRNRQIKDQRFRRQMVIGPYIVDFCCPAHKLIIEIDGGQHQENREKDKIRTRWLEEQGFQVLRFWNHQVLTSVETVVEAIFTSIDDDAME
ncbi:endonuclease domain-containing protein [Pelobacter seleniigenes]|uniref:endonuclease domain-containing protein n=1 Tax=Pelobacter seleniigenes TaxID=407188 RepID=UPI0004A6C9E4|nr:endonuclease domain-containing protein [Pelobacter seleniigenes]